MTLPQELPDSSTAAAPIDNPMDIMLRKQHEMFLQMMEIQKEKRPHAWEEMTTKERQKILMSKVVKPEGKLELEDLWSLAITERGPIFIYNSIVHMMDKGEIDLSKARIDETNRLRLTLHESPIKYNEWQNFGYMPDDQIEVIYEGSLMPIKAEELQQRMAENPKIVQNLDRAEAHFKPKVEQTTIVNDPQAEAKRLADF